MLMLHRSRNASYKAQTYDPQLQSDNFKEQKINTTIITKKPLAVVRKLKKRGLPVRILQFRGK